MVTAKEILSAEKCGDIFQRGTKESIISEYRALMKQFHPDICTLPNVNEIASIINTLYNQALNLIELDAWEQSNIFEVRDKQGKRYSTRYLKCIPFELGGAYIADLSITYVLEAQHKRFFENAKVRIGALRYADSAMEAEISRYMPKIRYSFETGNGEYCLILAKTADAFLLSDVLSFYNGQIPDRHIAWIVSRFNNICCYFDYLKIAHNGLSLENCLISPEHHTVLPLGGWWYAQEQGKSLLGVPRSVYEVMPVKAKSDKISSIITDLETSKYIGRQLIGKSSSVPKPIKSFLDSGSLNKPSKEFSRWNKVLDEAYGKRQFVIMDVKKADIYK